MKIYIIEGTTGKYEDKTEWIVESFLNKEAAEIHCKNAQRRANKINTTRADEKNEFDPNMIKDDMYDVNYYVLACELLDANKYGSLTLNELNLIHNLGKI